MNAPSPAAAAGPPYSDPQRASATGTASHRAATLWLLAERVLRVASGILVSSAVARHLGPGDYGALAVALGTVAVCNSIAGMGADSINLSELARRSEPESLRLLGSALVVRLLWSLVPLGALTAYLTLRPPADARLYALLVLSIPFGSFSISAMKLQADGRFVRYAVLSSSAICATACLRVVGVVTQMPLHYFAAAALFDLACGPLLFTAAVVQSCRARWSELRPRWEEARRYFLLCLPTAASAGLVMLYLRIELFAIDHVLGKGAAGLWAAAAMFLTPWTVLASTVLPVANRHLVKSGVGTAEHAERVVKLVRFMAALALGAAAVNVVAVHVVLPLLLGDKYRPIQGFIWIVSLSLLPLNMGSVQDVWIAHRRTTTIVLWKVIFGIPLSYGLLVFLAPRLGLAGAAVGMVASHTMTAIVFNLILDRGFLALQLRAIGVTPRR